MSLTRCPGKRNMGILILNLHMNIRQKMRFPIKGRRVSSSCEEIMYCRIWGAYQLPEREGFVSRDVISHVGYSKSDIAHQSRFL